MPKHNLKNTSLPMWLKRDNAMRFRISTREKEVLQQIADNQGLTLSRLIYQVLRAYIDKTIENK